jgi:hypothetical protein
MFSAIHGTKTFNRALGFATQLEEKTETIGAKGGFFIEKITTRKAATNIGNTWTQHVETRFVLRDIATNELQISGTLERCFDHIDAKLLGN